MLVKQRSEKYVNWEASNLPSAEDSKQNLRYSLENYDVPDTITDAMLETDANLEGLSIKVSPVSPDEVQTLRVEAEKAQPLHGANCALCEEHGASISLMLSHRYNTWCYSCHRSYFKGVDITDYTTWNYPGESFPSISPMAFDESERAMLEAGVVEYTDVEQPDPTEDPEQPEQTVNKEMTPTAAKAINLDAPEIKRLIYTRPSLFLLTMVASILCLPFLPWIFMKLN